MAKVALTEQSLLRDIPQIDHEESVVESTHTEQVHPVSEVLSKAQHETGATNDSSSEVDYSDAHTPQTTDRVINPIEDTSDIPNTNTMPYPYPRNNDEVDVEAHVRAFLTMWQANHVSIA